MNITDTNGGSLATTVGTFAISGAVNTHATTNTINYSIDGLGFLKTAITGGVTPTTDVNGKAISLVANKAVTVIWLLNAAGTVAVVQGPTVDWNGTDYLNGFPEIPNVPVGYAPFALSLIKAGSTTVGTWLFGTSLWNATGISTVVKNLVGGLPTRPVLS
jgi:hypothetical protein